MTRVCIVSAEAVIDVRWPVLRPGFPRESAIFQGDDALDTRHFGLYVTSGDEVVERLVSVASIYRTEVPGEIAAHGRGACIWQLRGMATLPTHQGSGLGSLLLSEILASLAATGSWLLWCNARTSAVDFYEKHGFQKAGAEFDILNVGPHFRMWLRGMIET